MATYRLGRDQTVTVAGIATGVREIDVEVTSKSHRLTGWSDAWESALVLSRDVRVRITALSEDVYDAVFPKFAKHPPEPVTIAVSNVGSVRVVPTAIRARVPVNGVMSWEMEFAAWSK